MDDPVERRQRSRISQDLRPKRGSIEASIWSDHPVTKSFGDLCQHRLPWRLGVSNQLVCVDNRCAPALEELGYGGFSRSYVACQGYGEHVK